MKFRRAVQRYGKTPEPETPYSRAGQLWDERIGSARVQARNWRLMAFGGLFLTAGLSSALIWQSLRARVVPYVVEVDRLGAARAVAPADVPHTPTDPQIAWFLARFIGNVRSRSLDPVLMRENWLAAYDFVTRKGAIFLGEYARADKPFADVGARTVSIQVTSVVRASPASFQVKWTEQAYERGSLTGTSRWTAMVTVKVRPPRVAEVLRKNPLGLYVDAIDWSRELEAQVPSRVEGSVPSVAKGAAEAPVPSPVEGAVEAPVPSVVEGPADRSPRMRQTSAPARPAGPAHSGPFVSAEDKPAPPGSPPDPDLRHIPAPRPSERNS